MGNGIIYDGVGNICIILAKASTEFYLLYKHVYYSN